MRQQVRVAILLLAVVVAVSISGAVIACEPPGVTQLVDDLKDDLESDDPAKQADAANSLARIVEDVSDAVPRLERLLNSKNTDARLAGVRALWAIRGKSKAHLPMLVPSLGDDKAYNRETAAEMLAQLGPQAASAVPQLTEALQDEDADVRIEAALALGNIGPNAKSAVPELVAALEDHSSSSVGTSLGSLTVSIAAGLGLRNIGPDAVPPQTLQ